MVNNTASMRHRPRLRAFSLVELLTVIAIIALLVAIILPSLGRAKELARETKCRANLNTLAKAIAMFAAENGRFVPSGDCNSNPGPEWLNRMHAKTWFELRDKYLPGAATFQCPSVNGKIAYYSAGTSGTEQQCRTSTTAWTANSWDNDGAPAVTIDYQYYGSSEWPNDSAEARDRLQAFEVLKIDDSSVLGGPRPPIFSDMCYNKGGAWTVNHGSGADAKVNVLHTDGAVVWKVRDADDKPLYDAFSKKWYW